MFHRNITHLSIAFLFLLSVSCIRTMDSDLELKKNLKYWNDLMPLIESLPVELRNIIDTLIPPITVQEKILDANEHAEYNLPFKFNSTETIAGSQLGQLGGCSVRYQDPASGDSHVIHTTYNKPLFHCLGPCRIKQYEEICLLKDSRDYIDGRDYTIWTLKKHLGEGFFVVSNSNRFIKYLQYSSPKAQKYCTSFEYVVDIDNEAQTFYTAKSSGEINAYRYNQSSDSCTKKLIKSSLEEKIIWWTARDMMTGGGTTDFDIQFDHTQPDVLLVLFHSSATAYSIIHRPTNHVQFFPGQKVDYRNGHQNIFPLLASSSESRLRLFGNNVGVKLVTATPHYSHTVIRTMQLVKGARELWENWDGTAEHKQAARDIIATFKTLTPKSADRYFWVWNTKIAPEKYALTELYKAQKESAV
jgi:hypothetical protein